MEELNGNYVDVVLAIEMARGMPILEHPLKIVVNFNGRPLETDLFISKQNLAFNTELAWEVEKKVLRKMRTNNIPLKVELQMVDDHGCKDRVGLILLSARSANIITRGFRSEIPFKWWKLVGVPAKLQRCQPELHMSLTIRDLDFKEDSSYSCVWQESDKRPFDSNLHGCTEHMFDNSHKNEDNQRVADTVVYLRGDSELPYLSIPRESNEHPCLDPHNSTEDIFTYLHVGDANQGEQINADTVLTCVKEPSELFSLDSHECTEDTFDDNQRKLIAIDGDDKSKPLLLRLTDLAEQTIPKSQPSDRHSPQSDVTMESSRATQSLRSIRPKVKKAAVAFQQYCFDLRVHNISFKNCFKSKIIGITFRHPKETSEIIANCHTIKGNITLKDARCKLIFISTEASVQKLVYAWPPKLFLTDETGQPLTEELNISTFKTNEYLTEFKAIGTHDTFANISITMCLDECEFSDHSKHNEFLLPPPLLDEYIVIRELCELQAWKDAQTQRARRTNDLEFLNELVIFHEDWYNGEENQIEEKLAINARRCETLTLELENAMDALHIKSALESTDGNMEKDTFFDSEKIALISTMSQLEYENSNLKNTIENQTVALKETHQTTLTIEQIAIILEQIRDFQEKIKGEQKATIYLKEKWKKIVREIHDLKSQKEKRKEEMQICVR